MIVDYKYLRWCHEHGKCQRRYGVKWCPNCDSARCRPTLASVCTNVAFRCADCRLKFEITNPSVLDAATKPYKDPEDA